MDSTHHYLLAQVATMYYEREMTQSEIGKKLDLSRVKVYRLLKEAKAAGVVQIRISWPIERQTQLEQALKQLAGLKEVLVLKTDATNGSPLLPRLGQLGAQYLEQILQDGMTLAICMGSSTYEVINAVSPDLQAHVRVAQATGSIPLALHELDSSAIARQLAQKLGGEVLYLSSPLIADSVEAAAVLRNQTDIKRTLAAAAQADVALLGIGNLDPSKSRFVQGGFITSEKLADLMRDGAVGDMAGQIFTKSGEPYPGPYNQQVIGLSIDDLCRIPKVIAVAAGPQKAAAVLGALRTCALKVLVTDDQTARAVLSLNGA
ncbi:MAG TPA: sugar-binding transcriptional regulator [Anaerolineae bacterium]|nr:sugar-binding transcriptional regulator [Anaerolineae bacterium]HMR67154.1 sugar-binding transcriptional regulator [Anaerolineae bacterium]